MSSVVWKLAKKNPKLSNQFYQELYRRVTLKGYLDNQENEGIKNFIKAFESPKTTTYTRAVLFHAYNFLEKKEKKKGSDPDLAYELKLGSLTNRIRVVRDKTGNLYINISLLNKSEKKLSSDKQEDLLNGRKEQIMNVNPTSSMELMEAMIEGNKAKQNWYRWKEQYLLKNNHLVNYLMEIMHIFDRDKVFFIESAKQVTREEVEGGEYLTSLGSELKEVTTKIEYFVEQGKEFTRIEELIFGKKEGIESKLKRFIDILYLWRFKDWRELTQDEKEYMCDMFGEKVSELRTLLDERSLKVLSLTYEEVMKKLPLVFTVPIYNIPIKDQLFSNLTSISAPNLTESIANRNRWGLGVRDFYIKNKEKT